MAEELRLFLRVALWGAGAGAVYWFLTYEWAGSVLTLFLVLGAAFVAVAGLRLARAARRAPDPDKRGPVGAVANVVGFAERGDEGARPPLELDEEALPVASVWPLVGGVGATLAGLGILYGPWFWLPGALLGLAALRGWSTELRRPDEPGA
ncbi:MAG TPA: hypothetical protein VHJ34_10275 [Actinomycetota bacterium]|nr:hypothetical protein [Actinomycetota bacterium]